MDRRRIVHVNPFEARHVRECKAVDSKTRTYPGRGGARRRTAARRAGAAQGRMGRRRVGSPRKQPSLLPSLPSRASKTTVLNVSSEARIKEILHKSMEQSSRLTRSVSAVDNRFTSGTKSALRSWLLTSVPTPVCRCKPFSCYACPGISRIQNPDIPRAGWGWAAHCGAVGQDGTPTGRLAQETPIPLAPRASKTTVLDVYSDARTNEILCKTVEEHNDRLTNVLSAAYPWDDGRSSFLAADQCTDAYLFVFGHFFMQGISGNLTEEHKERLTSGLSAGRWPFFVPGCWSMDLFFQNADYAKHIRENVGILCKACNLLSNP